MPSPDRVHREGEARAHDLPPPCRARGRHRARPRCPSSAQEPIDLFADEPHLGDGFVRIGAWNTRHLNVEGDADDFLPGSSKAEDFDILFATFARRSGTSASTSSQSRRRETTTGSRRSGASELVDLAHGQRDAFALDPDQPRIGELDGCRRTIAMAAFAPLRVEGVQAQPDMGG